MVDVQVSSRKWLFSKVCLDASADRHTLSAECDRCRERKDTSEICTYLEAPQRKRISDDVGTDLRASVVSDYPDRSGQSKLLQERLGNWMWENPYRCLLSCLGMFHWSSV